MNEKFNHQKEFTRPNKQSPSSVARTTQQIMPGEESKIDFYFDDDDRVKVISSC